MSASRPLTWLLALAAAASVAVATSKQPPNIVLVLVDDQDAVQESLQTMQRTRKLLVDQGLQVKHFYSPISVCCPSRSSLLRAQAAHNTNVTSVMPPYGGWALFNEFGYNRHYLPSFLKKAGYSTRYVGKLMNDHTIYNFDKIPPADFDETDFLLDPNTYNYLNASFSHNNEPVQFHPGEYSTDLVRDKAVKLIENASKDADRKPFFVGIAPIAPHSHIDAASHKIGDFIFEAPISAPRHEHLFQDINLNTSRESFNPDRPSGASWVKQLARLNQTNIDYITHFYQQRLRALQAVDELVEAVVHKLDSLGQLDNTFIFYTSDNGFDANAGHRRQPGKTLPYEEDIRVPFVVRGPGVPKGVFDVDSVYSIVDLGATILELAGASSDYTNDGEVMPITKSQRLSIAEAEEQGESATPARKQHHLSEYWVEGAEEGRFTSGQTRVTQKYRTVRVVESGGKIDFAYAVWCTGERELYDMSTDPDQMHNLLLGETSKTWLTGTEIEMVATRLDGLLLRLKDCVGDECRQPWKEIFPRGQVSSLRQALDPKFDDFFATLPRVKYQDCTLGYHRAQEHPFWQSHLAFNDVSASRFVIQSGQ
ncbi:hypothetical protein ACM66B_002223 [Microbotryomycetes sp. NB124-2]